MQFMTVEKASKIPDIHLVESKNLTPEKTRKISKKLAERMAYLNLISEAFLKALRVEEDPGRRLDYPY